jgi:translation initiation factor IF-2
MSLSDTKTNEKTDNGSANTEQAKKTTLSLGNVRANVSSTLSLGGNKNLNPSDILSRALKQMEKAESAAQRKELAQPKTSHEQDVSIHDRDDIIGPQHAATGAKIEKTSLHASQQAASDPKINVVNVETEVASIALEPGEPLNPFSEGVHGKESRGKAAAQAHDTESKPHEKNKIRSNKIDAIIEKRFNKYGIESIILEELDLEGDSKTLPKKELEDIEESEQTADLNASRSINVKSARFNRAATASYQTKKRKVKGRKQYGTNSSSAIVTVEIPDSISVRQLSAKMAVRAKDVLYTLKHKLDINIGLDDTVERDIAELLAEEYGRKVTRIEVVTIDQIYRNRISLNKKSTIIRCPVVTIMGHVDHGKTSLLDAIRRSKLVDQESGNITQHVNAYKIETQDDKFITFIDTPGHAAFEAMRSRGANVADIALLIVAADEGIMPQTIESINHIKNSSVTPILVITKMDKPGAAIDRIRDSITQYNFIPEEYGGDLPIVPVSSHSGENIEKLLDVIEATAAKIDLRFASDTNEAAGIVIDAKIDKIQGPKCTMLVQYGELKVGHIIACGNASGKIRTMLNDRGCNVTTATASMPVEVTGLSNVPKAGDIFVTVKSDKEAKTLIDDSIQQMQRQHEQASKEVVDAEALKDALFVDLDKEEVKKELNIILKVDVHGSIEAIHNILENIKCDEIDINIISSEVGNISLSDIRLAKTTKSFILGFNVRCDPKAMQLAKEISVVIRSHSIIYDLESDVKLMLSNILSPIYSENVIGTATVKEVFVISKIGNIAGCHITDGEVQRGAHVRILRDKTVIHEDKITSVRKLKEEVKTVKKGHDCGIKLANYEDFKVGDIMSVYLVIATARQV